MWRPVVMLPLFYPAAMRAYAKDSVCLESKNYGKFAVILFY